MHLTRCLQLEMSFINGRQIHYPNSEVMDINNKLELLSKRVRYNDEKNRQLKLDYERFSLEYHDLMKNTAHVKTLTNQSEANQRNLQLQVSEQNKRLQEFLLVIQNNQYTLVSNIKEVIDMISLAYDLIMVKQLRVWKMNQGLSGNGAMFEPNYLDTIQQWCEQLAEALWNTKSQILVLSKTRQTISLPMGNDSIDLLEPASKELTSLLVKLVAASFVIEKQPPQVMKTNTRFTATVRLLTGSKLNIQMTNPVVKVSIISGELSCSQ